MRLLAAPLMIAVALIMVFEIVIPNKRGRYRFLVWSFLTFWIGWGIEYIGLCCGWPFGDYAYSSILQPQLGGVPIAIGFAWVSIYLASYSMIQTALEKLKIECRFCWLVFAAPVALAMVGFDAIMEPAAVHLNYWAWQTPAVPLSNYIAWFVMGVVISILWKWLRLERSISPLFIHVYVAQILYFVLVLLDKVIH